LDQSWKFHQNPFIPSKVIQLFSLDKQLHAFPSIYRQAKKCMLFRYLSLYYVRFTLSICEGKGIFKNWTINLWQEGVWLSVCTSRREGWTTFNTIKGSCWNLDQLNSVCVMLWQRPKITWMASIVNPWAESILFSRKSISSVSFLTKHTIL